MVKVSIDKESYNVAFNELKNELDRFLTCIEAIELITFKKELISIEDLNKEILKGTTFVDAYRVAQLKGIEQAYKYYIENYGNYNLDNFSNNEIKKDVIEKLQEQHTTYLDAESEKIFNKLQKVSEILNSLHPSYSKALHSSYDGMWSVNVNLLHLLESEKRRV
jgi:hypothetical protein